MWNSILQLMREDLLRNHSPPCVNGGCGFTQNLDLLFSCVGYWLSLFSYLQLWPLLASTARVPLIEIFLSVAQLGTRFTGNWEGWPLHSWVPDSQEREGGHYIALYTRLIFKKVFLKTCITKNILITNWKYNWNTLNMSLNLLKFKSWVL